MKCFLFNSEGKPDPPLRAQCRAIASDMIYRTVESVINDLPLEKTARYFTFSYFPIIRRGDPPGEQSTKFSVFNVNKTDAGSFLLQ